MDNTGAGGSHREDYKDRAWDGATVNRVSSRTSLELQDLEFSDLA